MRKFADKLPHLHTTVHAAHRQSVTTQHSDTNNAYRHGQAQKLTSMVVLDKPGQGCWYMTFPLNVRGYPADRQAGSQPRECMRALCVLSISDCALKRRGKKKKKKRKQ